MLRKPRNPKKELLSRDMLIDIVFVGILICTATLALFWWTLVSGGWDFGFSVIGEGGVSEALGRVYLTAITVAFTSLVFFEMVRVQAVRMKYRTGFFSNKKLIGAIIVSLLLQLAVIYIPVLQQAFRTVALSAGHWIAIGAAVAFLSAAMAVKEMVAGRKNSEQ
jgi:Ca2+-transporting ATPase